MRVRRKGFLRGAASAAVASDEWPGLPCVTSKDGVAVQRLVIRADWTIVHMNGRQVPVEGLLIVVEDGRIADLTREPPTEGETIAIPGGIAFPGFINLHNHTINAPLFRGIVDDLPRKAIGESKVYSMLMPMGALAVSHLDPDELEALVALGLLEFARSGATARGRPRSSSSRNAGAFGSMRPPTCSRPQARSAMPRSRALRRAASRARPALPPSRSSSPDSTEAREAASA
jgi:cytosine/adenosine deaminase-related metal-dependent hydrolase